MRLLTYKQHDHWQLGVKLSGGVLDVAAASQRYAAQLQGKTLPQTMEELFATADESFAALQQLVQLVEGQTIASTDLLPEETLTPGPCVPRNGKIICVGLNYRRHAEESGMALPTSPVLFSKYANSLAASGEAIILSTQTVQFDYEAELALVIGKRAKNIPANQALRSVAGYCNANDLSARDLQFRTSQWMLGKMLDQFLPIGPYLVTADEVPDPQQLQVRCWRNGELCQDSNTADMIFSVATIISYLSDYLTLEPGDIISTGTPAGVISGKAERNWLQAGEEVSVEVTGLGRLVNKLV